MRELISVSPKRIFEVHQKTGAVTVLNKAKQLHSKLTAAVAIANKDTSSVGTNRKDEIKEEMSSEMYSNGGTPNNLVIDSGSSNIDTKSLYPQTKSSLSPNSQAAVLA